MKKRANKQPSPGQVAADEYSLMFINLDQILHPSIMADPRFVALLVKAVDRGIAITRAEVETIFGGIGWDE